MSINPNWNILLSILYAMSWLFTPSSNEVQTYRQTVQATIICELSNSNPVRCKYVIICSKYGRIKTL